MSIDLDTEYQYFSEKYNVSVSYIKTHTVAMHNKLIDKILLKKADFFQIVKDMLENEDNYNNGLFEKTLKNRIHEIEELEKDLERFQEILKYQNVTYYGF